MTASQLVNQLSKRKVEVIDFMSKLLIESGVLESKIVEIEKVVEKTIDVKPEELKVLEEKIETLTNDLKVSNETHAEVAKENKELIKAAEDKPQLEPWVVLKQADHFVVTQDRDNKEKPTLFMSAKGTFVSVANKQEFAKANEDGSIKLNLEQLKAMYPKFKDLPGVMVNPAFTGKELFTTK